MNNNAKLEQIKKCLKEAGIEYAINRKVGVIVQLTCYVGEDNA